MRSMRYAWRLAAVVAVATLTVTTACAPISDKTTAADPDKCTKDQLGTLYPGILTFGTDPARLPAVVPGRQPGQRRGGFEAAIAYAVAAKMKLRARGRAMGAGTVQRRIGSRPKDVRRQPI